MKRKSKRRAAAPNKGDVKIRLIGDGIPQLRRTISESGPSIPSEKEHASVEWLVKEFGPASESVWKAVKEEPSRLFTDGGFLVYSSENDIAGLVKSFLQAIVSAMGLNGEVEIHSEVGTFNIRPDLWIVTVSGIPVGIVEVKKPDTLRSPKAMSHPNVLGELFDFIKHLPNFYGVSPCFGILTNLNSWRFAWLPKDGVDELAAQEEDIEELSGNSDGSEDHQFESKPHSLEEDQEDTNEDKCDVLDEDRRFFHVSRLYEKTDVEALVKAISSCILKMINAKVNPFDSPFDRLNERTILKFVQGSDKAVYWTRLSPVSPKWDSIAAPKKYLFALQDMGRGADGRVWLTCSSSGAVCILKFMLSGEIECAQKEVKMWKLAYPWFPVHAEYWCGRPTVRMPYFASITDVDDKTEVELVRKCLNDNFVSKGLEHTDVAWRNVGFFLNAAGELCAVVFDLSSVKETGSTDDSWVTRACSDLTKELSY